MTAPIVALAGGLGNQLFQIAKALSIAKGNKVELDLNTSGSYRMSASVLLDLKLPNQLGYSEFKYSPILKLLFSRIITKSSRGKVIDRTQLIFFRAAFENLFKLINRKKVSVLRYFGIGYFPSEQIQDQSYLIGYFQSFHWIEDPNVYKIMCEIEPADESAEFRAAISQITSERAIAVHVRLGDYFQEDKFGILDTRYYLKALDEVDSQWRTRNIWVFSNDLDKAREMFVDISAQVPSITWVDDMGKSPVYSWQLMRHAKDFVVGNSTFSWWAAALRFDSSGKICAPQPWFKDMPTPNELLPLDWKKIQSKFLTIERCAKSKAGINE